MASGTGSLIEIHSHENYSLLEALSFKDGKLYYENLPISAQLSKSEKNAIVQNEDGLFVDSSYFLSQEQYQILSKFSFSMGCLMYNGKIIAWEYTEQQLNTLNTQVWNTLDEDYPFEDTVDGTIMTADNSILLTKYNKIFTGGVLSDS